MSLNAADDGRRATVDRLEHVAERVRLADVRLVVELDRRAHPLDVGAGREALPFAGQDDGAGPADVDERLGQLRDQLRVERVARLRSRERDAQDLALSVDA